MAKKSVDVGSAPEKPAPKTPPEKPSLLDMVASRHSATAGAEMMTKLNERAAEAHGTTHAAANAEHDKIRQR